MRLDLWVNMPLFSPQQKNKVQSGNALKKSPLTPGSQACHLGWACQASGPGTPSQSGSRWALLMQMTAEESINSPGACLSWAPRLGGREQEWAQWLQ